MITAKKKYKSAYTLDIQYNSPTFKILGESVFPEAVFQLNIIVR